MAEIKTVSGTVVTFDDAEATALESLVTGIVATQEGSGNPSQSNVRPISGFDSIKVYNAGKNVCGGEAFADNIVNVVNSSRAIKGEDSDGKYVRISASYDINHKAFAINKFNPNTQYTLVIKAKKHTSTMSTNLAWRYTDGTVAQIYFPTGTETDTAVTFVATSASNKSVSTIEGFFASGYTDIYYEETGVFEGIVTVDDFVPSRTIVTTEVQLGQTVYGGILNVTTGELTITHVKIVLDGTQNIRTVNWRPTDTTRAWLYYYNVTNNKTFVSSVLPDALCDTEPIITYVDMYNGIEGVALYTGTQYGLLVRVSDTSLETVEAINTYLAENPITVVYPLATPITVQLSATTVRAVSGTNTIWSDSGDVGVSYRVYEEDIFDGRTMNFQYYGLITFKHNQSWGSKFRDFNNNSISSESIEIIESMYDPQNFRIGGGILPQLKIRFFKENIDFADVSKFTLAVVPFDNPNYRFVYTNSNMTEQEVIDISTGEVLPTSEYASDTVSCGGWRISDFIVSSDGNFVDVTATKQLAFETEETTGFNAWYDNLYDSQNSVAIKDLMQYWWETYFYIGSVDTSYYVNRNINVAKCFSSYPGIRNFAIWLSELNGIYLFHQFNSAVDDLVDIKYGAISPKEYTTYQGGSLKFKGSKSITKLVIIDSSRGFRWETGNNDGLVYTITEESNPLIKGIALSDLSTVGTNLFNEISNKPFYDISFVSHGDFNFNVGDSAKINVDGEEVIFPVTNRVLTGCQHLIDEISSTIPSIVENGQITSGEVEASYRNYVSYQNNLTDGDVKYLTDGDYLIRTTRVTNLPNTGTTEGFYLIKRTAMNGNAYMLCYGFSTQKLYVGSYNSTSDTLTWIECVTDISGKQDVITGAITPYLQANATADRIIASDANGKLTVSAVGAQALYSAINNISGLTGGKIVVTSSAGGSFVTSTIDASDLFALYTNITGLTGGNRVVLTSSSGGSLITSTITGTDLSNTVNHVNDDLSTGYSMLSLADGNIASGTTFNFSRQFIIPKAGLYYVHALARWSANATGVRVLAIHSSGTQEVLDDNSIYMFTSNMASPGNMVFIQHLTGLLRVTSDTKYFWIRGYQNSGSTLGTNFRVQFVKLTDSTSVIT